MAEPPLRQVCCCSILGRPVSCPLRISCYGDVFVTWAGAKIAVVERVQAAIYQYFELPTQPSLHQYFDRRAHGEQLRLLCRSKMVALENTLFPAPENLLTAEPKPIPLMEPTVEQLAQFALAAKQRPLRKRTEILMVEDQAFSRKLLGSMLERDYTVHAAEDALGGFTAHLAHAPDIVLLDIELPDMGGHELAATIRRYDPAAYIVMVTGNSFAADVAKARDNGVKGFVVKPYSKHKIYEAIEAFQRKRF